MTKNTILFQAHELSPITLEAFNFLKNTAGEGYSVKLLLDIKDNPQIPPSILGSTVPFDSREFANWDLPVWGRTMLPGHCHFPLLRYYLSNTDYNFLWLIEYDVRFTGKWNDFLKCFEKDDADLLCCHLKNRFEEPNWSWWHSFKFNERNLDSKFNFTTSENVNFAQESSHLRCFLVISRYSKAALSGLISTHRSGWIGHQEVVIPTSLAYNGLKIRDFNGRAINCDVIKRSNNFYTSASDLEGSMQMWGSIRFRPAYEKAGWRRNYLYHPVKPFSKRRLYFLREIKPRISTFFRLFEAYLVRIFSASPKETSYESKN